MPSCRLGLYVALRHWCPPGGRVLMSPVNDDVIFFVVLAAGLRPVQAPLKAEDGTIDLAAVPASDWTGLSAVITTNLYGNPDPVAELRERCDTLRIPLIEDAAHAIGSEVAGRPVGGFGDASVFSLSKHTGAKTGGFLAVADPSLRPAFEQARDALLEPGRLSAELMYELRPYAEAGVRGLRLTGAARTAMRLLGLQERDGIRMELRPGELKQAMAAAAGTGPAASGAPALDDFRSWVRVDMHDYRLRPGRLRLARTGRLLARLDSRLAAHRAGTRKLLATEWALPQPGPVQPLFRVPLLVADRDAAIAALARRRITVGYLYDPPLDTYAGDAFTDRSPAPEQAAWFARHALPVDPLIADRAIAALRASATKPAGPPPGPAPRPTAAGPDNSSDAGAGTDAGRPLGRSGTGATPPGDGPGAVGADQPSGPTTGASAAPRNSGRGRTGATPHGDGRDPGARQAGPGRALAEAGDGD